MSIVKTIMLRFSDQKEASDYLTSKGWKFDTHWFKGRSDLDDVGVIRKTLETFTIDDDGNKIFDTVAVDGWHVNIYTQCPKELSLHDSLVIKTPSRIAYQ